MSSNQLPQYRPNIRFSHFGFAVKDIVKQEDFYTRVLGFTVTDRGNVGDMGLVFLSRNPAEHHQIVLASGKPDNIPPNPYIPQFGSVINQISFNVATLQDLREIHGILESENVQSIMPANHGIAWSIYCHDPEGNNLEFFVDSDWYFPQPFLIPLEFSKTDDQILTETEALCREQAGFEDYSAWRARFAKVMNTFVPAK